MVEPPDRCSALDQKLLAHRHGTWQYLTRSGEDPLPRTVQLLRRLLRAFALDSSTRLLAMAEQSFAEHGVAECSGGVGLHTGQDVLVDGHRERGAAVAETFADDLHGNVRLQQD